MEQEDWRSELERLKELATPRAFQRYLQDMPEELRDDPGIVVPIYAAILEATLGEAMLAASLGLPKEEAKEALGEIEAAAWHLRSKEGLRALSRPEQQMYRNLAELMEDLGEESMGLVAMFEHYIEGDYDLGEDPNRLIQKANRISRRDAKGALDLVGRAGALALRGKKLWKRWPDEVSRGIRRWVFGIINVVSNLSDNGLIPLQEVEVERKRWPRKRRKPKVKRRERDEELMALMYCLFEGEGALTPELVRRIRREGKAAIPYLMDIVWDESLWSVDSPGGGWAPIHAVTLLGKLGAVEAAELLVDVVADSDPEDIIHSAAVFALEDLGRPALDAVLDFLRYSTNVAAKISLAEVVGEIGRGDERAYEELVNLFHEATWPQGKCLVCSALGDLGDKRAIPLLREALRDPRVDELDADEIIWALGQLGVDVDRDEGVQQALRRIRGARL